MSRSKVPLPPGVAMDEDDQPSSTATAAAAAPSLFQSSTAAAAASNNAAASPLTLYNPLAATEASFQASLALLLGPRAGLQSTSALTAASPPVLHIPRPDPAPAAAAAARPLTSGAGTNSLSARLGGISAPPSNYVSPSPPPVRHSAVVSHGTSSSSGSGTASASAHRVVASPPPPAPHNALAAATGSGTRSATGGTTSTPVLPPRLYHYDGPSVLSDDLLGGASPPAPMSRTAALLARTTSNALPSAPRRSSVSLRAAPFGSSGRLHAASAYTPVPPMPGSAAPDLVPAASSLSTRHPSAPVSHGTSSSSGTGNARPAPPTPLPLHIPSSPHPVPAAAPSTAPHSDGLSAAAAAAALRRLHQQITIIPDPFSVYPPLADASNTGATAASARPTAPTPLRLHIPHATDSAPIPSTAATAAAAAAAAALRSSASSRRSTASASAIPDFSYLLRGPDYPPPPPSVPDDASTGATAASTRPTAPTPLRLHPVSVPAVAAAASRPDASSRSRTTTTASSRRSTASASAVPDFSYLLRGPDYPPLPPPVPDDASTRATAASIRPSPPRLHIPRSTDSAPITAAAAAASRSDASSRRSTASAAVLSPSLLRGPLYPPPPPPVPDDVSTDAPAASIRPSPPRLHIPRSTDSAPITAAAAAASRSDASSRRSTASAAALSPSLLRGPLYPPPPPPVPDDASTGATAASTRLSPPMLHIPRSTDPIPVPTTPAAASRSDASSRRSTASAAALSPSLLRGPLYPLLPPSPLPDASSVSAHAHATAAAGSGSGSGSWSRGSLVRPRRRFGPERPPHLRRDGSSLSSAAAAAAPLRSASSVTDATSAAGGGGGGLWGIGESDDDASQATTAASTRARPRISSLASLPSPTTGSGSGSGSGSASRGRSIAARAADAIIASHAAARAAARDGDDDAEDDVDDADEDEDDLDNEDGDDSPAAAAAAAGPSAKRARLLSDIDDEEAGGWDNQMSHYDERILGLLDTPSERNPDMTLREEMYDVDSSDSETEINRSSATSAGRAVARSRLRAHRARELTAIARTIHPSTPAELEAFEKLQAARADDREERSDRMRMYTPATQNLLQARGEDMEMNSLYHNTYWRQAFRAGVPRNLSVNGATSAQYDANQGNIRDHLLNVIQADNRTRRWTAADFPRDVWPTVQFMLENTLSNSSTRPLLRDQLSSGGDLDDVSARVAFHHIAWKEARAGRFTAHALNPVNLTARNDIRLSRRDPSRVGGAHNYDHMAAGFNAKDTTIPAGQRKGGIFRAIDSEATYHTLKPIARPRLRRAQIIGDIGSSSAAAGGGGGGGGSSSGTTAATGTATTSAAAAAAAAAASPTHARPIRAPSDTSAAAAGSGSATATATATATAAAASGDADHDDSYNNDATIDLGADPDDDANDADTEDEAAAAPAASTASSRGARRGKRRR